MFELTGPLLNRWLAPFYTGVDNTLKDTIASQAQTVATAPVPFLVTLFFVGWVIWKVVQREYANRLADKDSKLELAAARVADYEKQLAGASPSQAREQIDKLEARLARLEPRKIGADQRGKMRAVLASIKGVVSIGADMACADAPQFSSGLTAAFRDAGWETINPSFMGLSNPPASGLGLRIPDPLNPSPIVEIILRAFREAGLEFDIQQGVRSSFPGTASPDAELVICPKVLD